MRNKRVGEGKDAYSHVVITSHTKNLIGKIHLFFSLFFFSIGS